MIWQSVGTAENVVNKEYMMNKITLHLTEEESRIFGYGLVPYRKMMHPEKKFLLDPPEEWTLRGQLIEQYEAKICWETLDSLLTDDSYQFDGTDLVIDPIVALFMLLKLYDAFHTIDLTKDIRRMFKETRADLKKHYESIDPEADYYVEKAQKEYQYLRDYASDLYCRLQDGYGCVTGGDISDKNGYALGMVIFSKPGSAVLQAPLYEYGDAYDLMYERNPILKYLDDMILKEISYGEVISDESLLGMYGVTRWELMDKYLTHIMELKQEEQLTYSFYFSKRARKFEIGDLSPDPMKAQAEWEEYLEDIEYNENDSRSPRMEYEKQVLDSIYDKLAAAIDDALGE